MTIKVKEVCEVTVTDPDSNLPVELTVLKLETGGVVAIDSSWLASDEGPTYSPFDCVDGCPVELEFDE